MMDTSDEWVKQRTGIEQRHFCPEGQGVADLAVEAARVALADAGRAPAELDYIIFNTMTPDHIFPGSGSLLGAALGCHGVPAIDLRMQCAASLFSLQLADGLFRGGAVRNVLLVGAEAQAGFMPWNDWAALEPGGPPPSAADYERATRHRGFAVIFGDGAGALLLERESAEPTDGVGEPGLLSLDVHTDGRYVDQLYIPAGFRTRPYVSHRTVDHEEYIPQMLGREVFKHAITKLPTSVRQACADAGVTIEQIDWFIAHQANDRINDAVRERLRVPAEKVPSNIARYGNTSTATIPILIDEMRRDGRLQPGQLVCVLALGAGLHWGAAVLRI